VLLAVPTDVMAQWKRNIRTHYPDLLKKIETRYGLEGALRQLESGSFPLRAIGHIWVMICVYTLGFFSFHTAVHSKLLSRQSCISHTHKKENVKY